MKKLYWLIVLSLLAAGLFYYRSDLKNYWLKYNQPQLPVAQDYQTARQNQNSINTEEIPVKNDSLNLQVPFTVQAPDAIWDENFKEACEEASLLMVDAFYNNYQLTPELAKTKLLEMIDWQKQNWQGHFDLNVKQTAELAEKFFGYENFIIMENPTILQIKDYLDQGLPIIMPAAGRLLNNPHFTSPGPLYHMLVIKGYTKDGFITNDPGTKFGEDYFYTQKIIMDSLADWQNENFTGAAKKILILEPKN